MYNTTTSITLLITLLFTSASAGCLRANQLGIGWLFTGVHILDANFFKFYFNCFLMQARPALKVCGQLVSTARKSIRTTYIYN